MTATERRAVHTFEVAVGRMADAQYTGDADEVAAAAELVRTSLAAVPVGHSTITKALPVIWQAALYRLDRTGITSGLAESLAVSQDLLAASGHPEEGRSAVLLSRCAALLDRARGTRDTVLLDEAIRLGRESRRLASARGAVRPLVLSMLGDALSSRWERVGDPLALDEAVELYREAASLTRAAARGTQRERENHAESLHSLGSTLLARFELTGDTDALDESVSALGEASELVPPEDARHRRYRYHLGSALVRQFLRTGDSSALQDAIRTHRSVLVGIPIDHPERPQYLAGLAAALGIRYFQARGDHGHMEEAIQLAREAVATLRGDSVERASVLSDVGMLLNRMSQIGSFTSDAEEVRRAAVVAHGGDPADMDLARHIDGLPPGRDLRQVSKEYLAESVEIARQAVQMVPLGDHRRVPVLHRLGLALVEQCRRGGDQALLQAAAGTFEEAARTTEGDPMSRLLAAREWGELSAKADAWQSASEAYRLAVGLVAHISPSALRRDDQEHRLSLVPHLASDAAAAVLRGGGDAVEALELLEQGRGVEPPRDPRRLHSV